MLFSQAQSAKRPFNASLVEYTTAYSAVGKDCELFLEAVAENLAIKQRVLQSMIEAVGPDCVLATNTSSIDLSLIASKLSAEEKVLLCASRSHL